MKKLLSNVEKDSIEDNLGTNNYSSTSIKITTEKRTVLKESLPHKTRPTNGSSELGTVDSSKSRFLQKKSGFDPKFMQLNSYKVNPFSQA